MDADRRLFVVGELFAPVSQLEERKPRIGLSHFVSSYRTLWFFDNKGLRWLLGRHAALRLGGVIVEESVEWLVGS